MKKITALLLVCFMTLSFVVASPISLKTVYALSDADLDIAATETITVNSANFTTSMYNSKTGDIVREMRYNYMRWLGGENNAELVNHWYMTIDLSSLADKYITKSSLYIWFSGRALVNIYKAPGDFVPGTTPYEDLPKITEGSMPEEQLVAACDASSQSNYIELDVTSYARELILAGETKMGLMMYSLSSSTAGVSPEYGDSSRVPYLVADCAPIPDPEVIATSPEADATEVDPESNITFTLSEAPASISKDNITLVNFENDEEYILKDSEVSFNAANLVVTVNPESSLRGNSRYFIKLSGLKNSAGKDFAESSLYFTTAASKPVTIDYTKITSAMYDYVDGTFGKEYDNYNLLRFYKVIDGKVVLRNDYYVSIDISSLKGKKIDNATFSLWCNGRAIMTFYKAEGDFVPGETLWEDMPKITDFMPESSIIGAYSQASGKTYGTVDMTWYLRECLAKGMTKLSFMVRQGSTSTFGISGENGDSSYRPSLNVTLSDSYDEPQNLEIGDISFADNTATVTITQNTIEDMGSAALIVAGYCDNELKAVKYLEKDLYYGVNNFAVTLDDPNGATSFKTFLWNDLETLTPIKNN
ncbi:MAG: Ig-like domain-containing protein [Clostridia bacterium]|nr:Ig-like domain-containing protein [Clostridia bacterium]